MNFEKKNKYIVINIEDLSYLAARERTNLEAILGAIELARKYQGKASKEYVCISNACKCYDEAWKLLEREVSGNLTVN